MCSTKLIPLASWQSSLIWVKPPNSRRMRRLASSRRQPGPQILLHLLLEMESQLLIDPLGKGGAPKEGTQTIAKVAKHRDRLLNCFQNPGDRGCQLFPGIFLDLELCIPRFVSS